jgi:colicin import membrane protein
MKWMLVLSGAFHIAFVLVSMTVSFQSSRRLEPVTVVSLVGGSDIPQKLTTQAPLAEVPSKEAPSRSAPARKEDIPVKKTPEKTEKPKASVKKQDIDPNALTPVEERLKRMREEQESSDLVRRAIAERRSAAAAREAVYGVKERVARRIESPSSSSGRDAVSGIGGSRGTVSVSPEMLEFFGRLESRVRESWILSDVLARDTSGLIVEMRITIEKDGRVSDTRIEKGSGNIYFDESVKRAIQKASPLPIPPERLRGGENHYEVGFRFHGAGGRG